METITVASGDTAEVTTSSEIDVNTPISIVQIQIPNQPVQVQSVIHPAQTSVIQTTGGSLQTIQVAPVTDGDTDEEADGLAKKRREILARRPSYRKILNELSSEQSVAVAKVEEEENSSDLESEGNEAATNLSTAGVQYQTAVMPAQIQLAGGDAGQGLQTLTMTNSTAASNQGTTIVQYAQGPDGQFFIPVSNLSGNTVQAYQIAAPSTTLPGGVVMATAAGSPLTSPHQLTEEVSRKRELRLLKNRDAARECRRKKKEYVKCLENRVAVLENQNKALIEELKSLKELYCQKEG